MIVHADKLTKVPYGTWLEASGSAAVAGVFFIASRISKRSATRKGMQNKIVEDFREIAATPLPARNDPRLKSWNLTDRLFKEEPEKILV